MDNRSAGYSDESDSPHQSLSEEQDKQASSYVLPVLTLRDWAVFFGVGIVSSLVVFLCMWPALKSWSTMEYVLISCATSLLPFVFFYWFLRYCSRNIGSGFHRRGLGVVKFYKDMTLGWFFINLILHLLGKFSPTTILWEGCVGSFCTLLKSTPFFLNSRNIYILLIVWGVFYRLMIYVGGKDHILIHTRKKLFFASDNSSIIYPYKSNLAPLSVTNRHSSDSTMSAQNDAAIQYDRYGYRFTHIAVLSVILLWGSSLGVFSFVLSIICYRVVVWKFFAQKSLLLPLLSLGGAYAIFYTIGELFAIQLGSFYQPFFGFSAIATIWWIMYEKLYGFPLFYHPPQTETGKNGDNKEEKESNTSPALPPAVVDANYVQRWKVAMTLLFLYIVWAINRRDVLAAKKDGSLLYVVTILTNLGYFVISVVVWLLVGKKDTLYLPQDTPVENGVVAHYSLQSFQKKNRMDMRYSITIGIIIIRYIVIAIASYGYTHPSPRDLFVEWYHLQGKNF